MNPSTDPAAARSFRDWSQARPLVEVLARAEAAVRAQPQHAQARWLLFELLCVLGHWPRALRQLQVWAGLPGASEGTAQLMRGLVRAEHQRVDVLEGRTAPATVTAADTQAMPWMGRLGDALRVAAAATPEALEAADRLRESALAEAPETPGRRHGADEASFAWISDSDTRLGPVCEVILLGAYRWLPFADVASVHHAAPARLLDLVWMQADIVLRDGSPLKGYLPMRYPAQPGDRDALLLGRETLWQDVGRSGVFARGQKVWTTDVEDIALLDLRHAEFGTSTDAGAPRDGIV